MAFFINTIWCWGKVAHDLRVPVPTTFLLVSSKIQLSSHLLTVWQVGRSHPRSSHLRLAVRVRVYMIVHRRLMVTVVMVVVVMVMMLSVSMVVG